MTRDAFNPLPGLAMVVLHHREGRTTFVMEDGRGITLPAGTGLTAPSSAVACTRWLPATGLVHVETTAGDQFIAEMPSPWEVAPIDGRPVVYLDQKDWSTLAKTIHSPAKVRSSAEREAAEAIIDRALERTIILPLSAGHMMETCQWTDDLQRYQLALTMLQLSNGWQMRDPLDVRQHELKSAFTSRYRSFCLLPRPTFTLEPDVLMRRDGPRQQQPDGFPADAAFALRALTSASVTFDVLLDGEAVPRNPVPGWADRLQVFTDWLAEEPRDRALQRRRTHTAVFADLTHEVALAAQGSGISHEQMGEWTLDERQEQFSAMPALGLHREVLHERLVDPQTRWEDNDLVDIMFLTCAAGYADHVVGDRAFIGILRQALRRLGRPASVHRRLVDLVGVL